MAETGMRDYRFALSAGVEQSKDVDGDYFIVVSAASEVQLKFDDGDWISRVAGDGMPVRFYKKVRVKSAADQVVNLGLGFTGGASTPVSARAKFDGIVNASVDFPSQRPLQDDVSIPAGDKVAVLAADADRLSAVVQLDEDAAGPVRVGDSSVSNTRGIKLQPDDAAECAGSAAIYVHNPNGVAVTVHLYTERAP